NDSSRLRNPRKVTKSRRRPVTSRSAPPRCHDEFAIPFRDGPAEDHLIPLLPIPAPARRRRKPSLPQPPQSAISPTLHRPRGSSARLSTGKATLLELQSAGILSVPRERC